MRLWDVASGQLYLMLDHGDHAVWDVVFTPDGTRTVTTSGKIVQVWDAVIGDALARFDHDDFVQKLVLVGTVAGWRPSNGPTNTYWSGTSPLHSSNAG